MNKKERFERVLAYFQETMPAAKTELNYKNAFELLVAVILSAQCTDKRVNLITPELLKHFPDPEAMSKSSPEVVFRYIQSCTYPNNKSKHLVGAAKMIMEQYGGQVPDDINELQKLPGVGRKTANVIASVIYNQPTLAVDTHVFRVAARIGLTSNAKTPLETEKQLVQYIPVELRHLAHHWLILHGRYICVARNPKCNICGLKDVCQFYQNKRKTNL